jgi:hypothetical protein
MRRWFLAGATALSLFGVLGSGVAAAGPVGSYTLTCAVGGQTSVDWAHAKLSQVTFAWSDQANTAYPGAAVPVFFKPPHGYVITPTPKGGAGLAPTNVTAFFQRTDGSGTDQVQAACN